MALIWANSVQFQHRVSYFIAKSVSFPHHFHSQPTSISTPIRMSGRSDQASNSILRCFNSHTMLISKEASTPCRSRGRTELVRFCRSPPPNLESFRGPYLSPSSSSSTSDLQADSRASSDPSIIGARPRTRGRTPLIWDSDR
jgi:hypothetical protein